MTVRITFATVVSLLLACSTSTAPSPKDDPASVATVQQALLPGMTPLVDPDAPIKGSELGVNAAAAGCQLTYFGGPIISSPKVYQVYWGPSVDVTIKNNAPRTMVTPAGTRNQCEL